MKKIIFIIITIFFINSISALGKENDLVKGNIAVFSIPQNSLQLNTVSEISLQRVVDIFNRLGRFLPVEKNRIKWAFKSISLEENKNIYQKVSELLEVDIYVLITIVRKANTVYGNVKIIPLSREYSHLRKEITVRSRIVMNIPLKLSREIALLHKRINIKADILGKRNNLYLINAGQWHGISAGKYKTVNGEEIKIVKTGRYRSLIENPMKDKSHFLLKIIRALRILLKILKRG